MSPITRRTLLQSSTSLALGASLAGKIGETSAALPAPLDLLQVRAWEDARIAADDRGVAWVKQAETLRLCLQLAVWQAQDMGVSEMAAPLTDLLAEAETILADREAAFDAWAAVAWRLDDLAPLPPEPWL